MLTFPTFRSVHNIRIERLWIDVFLGFAGKWKEFFERLEVHYNLDPNLDAHIWLLHHLFLDAINKDSEDWMAVWNNHTISSRTESYRTPAYMYTHGMVHSGVRGIFAPTVAEDPVEDPGDGYGIDFDDIDNPRIREHNRLANMPIEGEDPNHNPFATHHPERLSHVAVEDPRCPFNTDGVASLDTYLSSLPCRYATDMPSRATLWTVALQYASQMFS